MKDQEEGLTLHGNDKDSQVLKGYKRNEHIQDGVSLRLWNDSSLCRSLRDQARERCLHGQGINADHISLHRSGSVCNNSRCQGDAC